MSRSAGVAIALVWLTTSALGAVEREPVDTPPPTTPPRLDEAAASTLLDGRWARMPRAPWGSHAPIAVAAGGTMLVVDPPSGRIVGYDPDERTWTRGPRAPRRFGPLSPAVWTGGELVVLDRDRGDRVLAYDPSAREWRRLGRSPLAGHDLAVLADGAIVVAHLEEADGIAQNAMARYDIATDSWTPLPSAPGANRLAGLYWTGSEVMAVTTDEEDGPVQVAALDLAAEAWDEPVVGPLGGLYASAAWTGDRLVFSGDGAPGEVADASFDPATGLWQAEAFDCPVWTRGALWTGDLLVTAYPGYALDPVTGQCLHLPGSPTRDAFEAAGPRWSPAALWVGDQVLYWSGGGEEGSSPQRDGLSFAPERDDASPPA